MSWGLPVIWWRVPCQQSERAGPRSNQHPELKGPIYSSLDHVKKEIRILEVCNELSCTGKVVCRLAQVSLLSPHLPTFEALSWCWGDTSQLAEIELNGQMFCIPRNAEEVLRRVCFDHGHWLVWIDAICINQGDDTERQHQVAMMGSIYSSAEKTIVWLGEGNDLTDAAIRSMCLLWEQQRDTTDLVTAVDNISGEDESKSALPKASSWSPLPQCDWVATNSFFAAPWFSRLWTMQEVELAEDVVFYRGEYRVASVALWLVTERLMQKDLIGHHCPSFIGILRLYKGFPIPANSLESVRLLLMCVTLEVTNLHDKIYALLGLLERSRGSEFVAAFIRPDYRKPLHSVYIAATRMLIHSHIGHAKSSGLIVLNFVGRLEPLKEDEKLLPFLPSWVPSLNLRYRLNDPDQRPFIGTPQKAADGLPLLVASSHDPESPVLRLQGVIADSVTAMIPSIFGSLNFNQTSSTALVTEYCYYWAHLRESFSKDISFEKKYALTLVQGHSPDLMPGDEDKHEDEVVSQFRILMEKLPSDLGFSIMLNGPIEEEGQVAALFESMGSMWIFAQISLHTRGRALFITKNGLIGMGPPSIHQGDAICILFGGGTPFVLRPEGEHWKFVGDAYIYDLMDGNHIRKLKSEGKLEAETRWFDIH